MHIYIRMSDPNELHESFSFGKYEKSEYFECTNRKKGNEWKREIVVSVCCVRVLILRKMNFKSTRFVFRSLSLSALMKYFNSSVCLLLFVCSVAFRFCFDYLKYAVVLKCILCFGLKLKINAGAKQCDIDFLCAHTKCDYT